MSDFHLKAEMSPDSTMQEVTDIRAAAFKAALMHAATDDAMRAQMILGEAVNRYVDVIRRLKMTLDKENNAVRTLISACIDGRPITWQPRSEALAKIQQRLVGDWVDADLDSRWPH